MLQSLIFRHTSILFFYKVAFTAVTFFFFQAEDGIRDLTVTGVQTCALPILPRLVATFVPPDLRNLPEYREFMRKPTDPDPKILGPLKKRLSWEITMEFGFKIGRASCRERG